MELSSKEGFRRRADEGDGPSSSICGKTHPAGFIETMDFVNEQNRAASGIAVLTRA